MKRVLLVEDNQEVSSIVSEILTDAGYTVTRKSTLSSGSAALDDGGYDLVVTNVLLPGGSGMAIYNKAGSLGVPAILVTGHPDQMRIFEADGTPYMPKPFRAHELLDVVRRHALEK